MVDAAERQRRYYAETVEAYDDLHVDHGDEHFVALSYISLVAHGVGARTILDVGSGTGRSVEYLAGEGFDVVGVEPVTELIEHAVVRKGLDRPAFVRGSGLRLPFADQSFDVVCETGMLHHVQEPDAVVAEMARVARRAVFLSDNNRFAFGRRALGVAKLALWRTGLWGLSYRLRTRGRGYRVSGDDGVWVSYSVYDSLPVLAEWADRVFFVPTDRVVAPSWSHPLLSSYHVLLCAVRGEIAPVRPAGQGGSAG